MAQLLAKVSKRPLSSRCAPFKHLCAHAEGLVVDSWHYANGLCQTVAITVPGATAICIAFDVQSDTRRGSGTLHIYADELRTQRLSPVDGYKFNGSFGNRTAPGCGYEDPLFVESNVCWIEFVSQSWQVNTNSTHLTTFRTFYHTLLCQ
jgi:hypothetical protein